MKLIITLLLSTCVLAFHTKAQTKLIAHRSHSGNNSSFNNMLRSHENEPDNLGIAPTRHVTKAKLDSVIYIKNNVAVMVTQLVSVESDDYYEYNNTACINPGVWRPGRDTVYDHPLFSKQHSLDSIKKVLKQKYHFRNDIDQVKFIGYDNKKPKNINPKIEVKEPVVNESPITIAQQIDPAQNTATTVSPEIKPEKKKKKKWLWIGTIAVVLTFSISYTIYRWRKSGRFTP